VWSTGVKQVKLIEQLPDSISKSRGGRLQVDSHLRVLANSSSSSSSTADSNSDVVAHYSESPVAGGSVFALGDCACDSVKPLPALAQVASQQGKYIARTLNRHYDQVVAPVSAQVIQEAPRFKYSHLGSLASVGDWKGVFDSTNIDKAPNGECSLSSDPQKKMLLSEIYCVS
jgi:NADH:ubiquinone reductase (non-electrogenic)